MVCLCWRANSTNTIDIHVKQRKMKQRELKFRAWDKIRKEFLSNGNLFITINTGNKPEKSELYLDVTMPPDYTDRFILMQYTGLKDKGGEGKEMYHKDLIINKSRNGAKPHLIEWSDKFGMWVGAYKGFEYSIAQELHEIEVIGNIYENPKLKESLLNS